MRCLNCGKKIKNGNRYCFHCGVKAPLQGSARPGVHQRRRRIFSWIAGGAALMTIVVFAVLALTGVITVFCDDGENHFRQIIESNYIDITDEQGNGTGEIIVRGEPNEATWEVASSFAYPDGYVALAENALDQPVSLVVDEHGDNLLISIPLEDIEPGMPYTVTLADGVNFINSELKNARAITFIPNRKDVELMKYKKNVYEMSSDEARVVGNGILQIFSDRNIQRGDILVVPVEDEIGISQQTAFRVENVLSDGKVETVEPTMEEIFEQLEISGTYTMNPNDFVLDEEAVEKQVRESTFFDNFVRTVYAAPDRKGDVDIQVKMLPSKAGMLRAEITLTFPDAYQKDGKYKDLEVAIEIGFKAQFDINIVKFLVFDVCCDSMTTVNIKVGKSNDADLDDLSKALNDGEDFIEELEEQIHNDNKSILKLGAMPIPVAGPVSLRIEVNAFFEHSITGELAFSKGIEYFNKSGALISLTKFKPYQKDNYIFNLDSLTGIARYQAKAGVQVSVLLSVWKAAQVGVELEAGPYLEAAVAGNIRGIKDGKWDGDILAFVDFGVYGGLSLVAKINYLFGKVKYEVVLLSGKESLIQLGQKEIIDGIATDVQSMIIGQDGKGKLPPVYLLVCDLFAGTMQQVPADYSELEITWPKGVSAIVDKSGNTTLTGDIPDEFSVTIGHKKTDKTFELLCKKGKEGRLTTDNFIDLIAGEEQGSGGISPLTLRYRSDDNSVREAYLDYSTWVEPSIDFDDDGIVEIIVYNELDLHVGTRAEIEEEFWPTIYEIDLKKGEFVVATAENTAYLNDYLTALESLLSGSGATKNADGLFEFSMENYVDEYQYEQTMYRICLHTAAQLIVSGKFVPVDPAYPYPDVQSVCKQYVPIQTQTQDFDDNESIAGTAGTIIVNMVIVDENGIDYSDAGVIVVEGGFLVRCNIEEVATLSYDEYNLLSSGEIVDTRGAGKLRMTETLKFVNPDYEDDEFYIKKQPTPNEPSEIFSIWLAAPISKETGESRQYFVSDNTFVRVLTYEQGNKYSSVPFGGYMIKPYRYYAKVDGDSIKVLEEIYEP